MLLLMNTTQEQEIYLNFFPGALYIDFKLTKKEILIQTIEINRNF